MSFLVLPPKINSLLMCNGPGRASGQSGSERNSGFGNGNGNVAALTSGWFQRAEQVSGAFRR